MRKVMPAERDESSVTGVGRQLLALALWYVEAASVEHVVQYAGLSLEDCTSRLAALAKGDSQAWLALKEGEEEVRHAFAADRLEFGILDITFSSFWAKVWERSVYRAPQNLITIKADVWREHMVLCKADADWVNHAVTSAAYAAYCAAGRFDRFPTVVINGHLLKEAITIE